MEQHDSKDILSRTPITILYIISSNFKGLVDVQELAFTLWDFRPGILYIEDCCPWILLINNSPTIFSKHSKHSKSSLNTLVITNTNNPISLISSKYNEDDDQRKNEQTFLA